MLPLLKLEAMSLCWLLLTLSSHFVLFRPNVGSILEKVRKFGLIVSNDKRFLLRLALLMLLQGSRCRMQRPLGVHRQLLLELVLERFLRLSLFPDR